MQATEEASRSRHRHRPTEPREPRESGFEAERVAAFLDQNAARHSKPQPLPDAASDASAPPPPPASANSPPPCASPDRRLDDLDRTLTVLEEKLFAALQSSATEEELVDLTRPGRPRTRSLPRQDVRRAASPGAAAVPAQASARSSAASRASACSTWATHERNPAHRSSRSTAATASPSATAATPCCVPFTLPGETVEVSIPTPATKPSCSASSTPSARARARTLPALRRLRRLPVPDGELPRAASPQAIHLRRTPARAPASIRTRTRRCTPPNPGATATAFASASHAVGGGDEAAPKAPRLGYNRRATTEFLPITTCPIAAPVLWSTAKSLLAAAAARPRRRLLAQRHRRSRALLRPHHDAHPGHLLRRAPHESPLRHASTAPPSRCKPTRRKACSSPQPPPPHSTPAPAPPAA